MTMTYLGQETIGTHVPGPLVLMAAAMGDVQARLTALLSFAPSITPPSIAADLEVAASIVANLNASITIEPPSIELQVEIMANLTLALQLQLKILVDFTALFATAGLYAYAYDGTAANFGTELGAEVGGGFPGGAGGDHVNALILATSIPACWLAISQIFKVTP